MADVHWLCHCGSWFGFNEPACFVPHKDGGYFASIADGYPLQSRIQNGTNDPRRGLSAWASQENTLV